MPAQNRSAKQRAFLQYSPLEARQLLASVAPVEFSPFPGDKLLLADAKQESVARDYLAAGRETATLDQAANGLKLIEVQHGIASTVTRFQQTIDGIPVADAYVTTIQGPDREFVQVHDQSFAGNTLSFDRQTLIDFEFAEQVAMEYAGALSSFAPSRGELVWRVGTDKIAEPVWQVTVFGVTPETHGDFLTFVDPVTGKVISQENRISNFTTGTGDVFFPNPYQTQGSGTNLNDNNDANNGALTAQLINVTLEGLDTGTGLLTGEFADLATLNSSSLTDNDANELSRDYNYTRNDDRFEQVVIYHTVDQINRYFHTLGFDDDTGVANGIRDFATLANAHWDTADQSFYSTGDDAIHFGDGGVDDGEDGDIIAHEFGHAVQHDQNAAWGGGEMGAMGEGFGDYLAASFFENFGDASFQANHAAAVGEWDATSYSSDTPPNLRRVDGNKTYPGDLTGSVHADGEIWSRALWDINHAIGASIADQLILESHFLLPGSSSMVTAAEMILLADQNINGGANAAAIRQAFEDRGILEPLATIGTVTLDSAVYNVGDVISITVNDANAPATVPVTITNTNGDSETLTLSGSGGVYSGNVTSAAGAPTNGDGVLQAALGNTITVTYEDADDGNGNPLTVTDDAIFANVTEYASSDIPVAITDNNTIQSTITIVDSGALVDVDLQLDITHTWDSDLTAVLTAPNGEQITLFSNIGGSGDDFDNTRFDDGAAQLISNGSAPFSGSFRPTESFAALDAISITGVWTLSITDNATQDTGTLNAWSLFITVAANPEIGPLTDSDAANNDVVENASIGANVGITASASDPGDVVSYSLTNDAGGLFAIDSNSGIVTVAGALDFEAVPSHTIDVRATSSDTTFSDNTFIINVLNVDDAVISTRQVFYKDSSFDGIDPFDAVATDKQFLLTDNTATFDNYSTYWKGLNGLVIEVNDLNTIPTLANIGDFVEFNVGNDDTPVDWLTAPSPTGVSFESNVNGGSTDRLFLSWNDNAIENEWLEVKVLANATTGLSAPDLFYFGSVIAETGNDPTNAVVNLQDIANTRLNQTGFGSADIDNDFDFDRDGRVNLVDIAIARQNQSGFSVVNLITPGTGTTKSGSGGKGSQQFNLSYDSTNSDSVKAYSFDRSEGTGRVKTLSPKADDGSSTLMLAGSQIGLENPVSDFDPDIVLLSDSRSATDLNRTLDVLFSTFDFPTL